MFLPSASTHAYGLYLQSCYTLQLADLRLRSAAGGVIKWLDYITNIFAYLHHYIMLSKCMHGSPCIMHYALCMAVHASITLISQHGLSSRYYCMCYYVISIMHYISNASAIHHSSAGYARQTLHWALLKYYIHLGRPLAAFN
eukprot:jgi/Chrzof1/8182/Cz03g00220.t1